MPLSFDAVVDVLVEGARAAAGDAPFVLLGYSSGDQFAHAVAESLEKAGTPADALVPLDTCLPDGGGHDNLWMRCSRECWTARTASSGSAPHVWRP
ncbi:thioesterase domain-containing protein [Streptomyces niveus]|uniref:thioesterase domain-containing protein n=1 Tax=Streptomyces niveus TaxID=193462 RepID=UPI00343AF6E0